MANPKVYIPNKGCHDFSTAEMFGELIFLTTGKFNLLSIGRMYRTFQPIVDASSNEDYILVCGPSVMASILCSLFAIKHNCLNLLLYSASQNGVGKYKVRNIIFDPQQMEEVEL